jgi:hypothetical protein
MLIVLNVQHRRVNSPRQKHSVQKVFPTWWHRDIDRSTCSVLPTNVATLSSDTSRQYFSRNSSAIDVSSGGGGGGGGVVQRLSGMLRVRSRAE